MFPSVRTAGVVLAGVLILVSCPSLANVSPHIVKVDHEPMNPLGFGEFSCEEVDSYVKKIDAAQCMSAPARDVVCHAMRTVVNVQNWGNPDPVAGGIAGIKGGRLSLRRFPELAGRAVADAGPLLVEPLSDNINSGKIMGMNPVRGVPSRDAIFVKHERGVEIRSNAHYCDWLSGKLMLSFIADVPLQPEPMSEKERQEYWNAYEVARHSNVALKGESKALFQAYLFFSSLSEPLILAAGGVESLVSAVFLRLEVPQLQNFENAGELAGFIRFQSPPSSQKVKFILEAQK